MSVFSSPEQACGPIYFLINNANSGASSTVALSGRRASTRRVIVRFLDHHCTFRRVSVNGRSGSNTCLPAANPNVLKVRIADDSGGPLGQGVQPSQLRPIHSASHWREQSGGTLRSPARRDGRLDIRYRGGSRFLTDVPLITAVLVTACSERASSTSSISSIDRTTRRARNGSSPVILSHSINSGRS